MKFFVCNVTKESNNTSLEIFLFKSFYTRISSLRIVSFRKIKPIESFPSDPPLSEHLNRSNVSEFEDYGKLN